MNLQVLQHLSVPEALGDINVGNSFRCSNVPDPSIPSGGDPQVLLETRDSTCSTGLIFVVTSRSPGDKVRFQNLGSEVVIPIVAVWVVSAFLGVASVALDSTERRKLE